MTVSTEHFKVDWAFKTGYALQNLQNKTGAYIREHILICYKILKYNHYIAWLQKSSKDQSR